MALWLSELLTEPLLNLRLVAGRAGIDQHGPVRWAHISELADPTPWLEGGELVLTTGLGLGQDEHSHTAFVSSLRAAGVVGLGFGLDVSLAAVPEALVDACEAHSLPLFTVPYEVPFIAVTQHVAHRRFEEHHATLRAAVDLHRQVLATVVADLGLPGVLRTVGRAMPATALIVLDFSGTELGRSDPTEVAAHLSAEALRTVLPPGRGRTEIEVAGRHVLRAPVVLGEHLEAFVVAVRDGPLAEAEMLLFEQAIAGVSLELARHRSVRDARRARIDELLEEIAAGRSDTGLVARTLGRLGVVLPEPYRVLALELPGAAEPAPPGLCALIEDTLAAETTPIVGRLDGAVYALVPDTDEFAPLLHATATARGWPQLIIGRSRAKRDIGAARAALREAGVALRLDSEESVRDVDTLGLTGLIAGIRDDLGAEDFVQQVLGPVLAHDTRESARLINTVRAYLAHGCRPGPAAEQLGIHRHTLAYRLDRIRDLTGRDPRSGEHLVTYGLALQLLGRTET